MLIFAHDGTSVFEGVWSTITSAKSFDANLLTMPKDATYWVRYTTGGTAALKPGEILTGSVSTKTCTLVAQAVEVGTAGSSDTGILFLKSPSGTFQAETLTGGTSTGTVAIIQDLIALNKGNTSPKAALIVVETAAITCTISGVTPTVSAGTNHGIKLDAGQSWVVRGINNIRNFKAINTVNASGAILKYQLFF